MSEVVEVAAILKDACARLSAVCDGAVTEDGLGFNKPDQGFGKHISLVDPGEWDVEACHVVREMLAKYRQQLSGYGVDVDALPRVETTWEREPTRAKVAGEMKAKAARAAARADLERVSSGEMALGAFLSIHKVMAAVWNGDSFELYSPKNMELIGRIKAAKWTDRKWTGRCWTMRGEGLKLLPAILDDFGFIISESDRAKLDELIGGAERAAEQAAQRPNVWVEDGKIATRTDYDPALVGAMKGIRGREWAGKNGGPRDVNYFPLVAGRQIVDLASRFNLRIDPSLEAEIEKAEAKVRERIDASQATDAEIEIAGLGSGELKLRPFQRGGIKYASEAKRCFVADEMGLGKTIQALGVIQAQDAYPALVVVPKAVKYQWAEEIGRWLPGRTAQIVSGGKAVELVGDIVVINYDLLSKHIEGLKGRAWKAIVLDESQQIKNKKAKRSKAALELAEGIPVRLCLSGTPLLNRPVELVNQLAFLGRLGEFGGGWEFMRRYCGAKRTRFGWDMTGATNLDELARKLRASCYVRRVKRDVAKELPPLQRTEVPVEIERKREYRSAVADVVKWVVDRKVERGALPAGEALSAFDRAYKAEALVRINGLRQLAVEHKLNGAIEWIGNFLDSDGKLVVFAHHRAVQEKLAEALADYDPATISGGDSDEQREAAKDKFWNEDSCRVMIASMQAANFGLNLQVASSVAFVEFGWHMAIMEQAEARVHRIGSEASSVNSYWLFGRDTFDENMIELIKRKGDVVDAVNRGEEIPENVSVIEFLEGFVAEVTR